MCERLQGKGISFFRSVTLSLAVRAVMVEDRRRRASSYQIHALMNHAAWSGGADYDNRDVVGLFSQSHEAANVPEDLSGDLFRVQRAILPDR